MRRAFVALALTGCNQLYGLDETRVDRPTECATIRFGPPMPIEQFEGSPPEFDPQLSADGRELWFAQRVEDGTFALSRGTRATPDEPFVVTRSDLAQTQAGDPALTADGLRLMFFETAVGVVEAVRANLEAPFQLRSVVGVPPVAHGIDLSWDGLRLYYVDPDEVLWMIARPSLDEPFEDPVMLFASAQFPTVSPDELEIFYTRPAMGGALFRRTRPARDAAFGDEELVLDQGYDPDIAPGADTLLVARDDGLAVLERVCPGK